MAATWADDIFKCFFFNENILVSIKNSLNFVPKDPIDNKPLLVQVMAWSRIGNKSLQEPMLTQFNYIYMRHPASTNRC